MENVKEVSFTTCRGLSRNFLVRKVVVGVLNPKGCSRQRKKPRVQKHAVLRVDDAGGCWWELCEAGRVWKAV